MKNKLINYERLDELVRKYEKFMSDENLDLDEQKLLADIMRDRREQALAQMRARDMTMSMPLGSLFKKLTRHQEKPEEED